MALPVINSHQIAIGSKALFVIPGFTIFGLEMIAEALNKTGSYSEQDLMLFEKEVTIRDFAQDELILNVNEVARSAYYIVSGAVYQYSIADEIDQVILELGADGSWMLDQKSFVAQQPADTYIKAYQKSRILELSIDAIHKLIALSPTFFQLGRLVDGASQRTNFFDQSLSPLEKYQSLISSTPLLLQKFPLKMIASYLKVTPETLSRVRKKIVASGIS
ncbi:MAG: Crp/Fnr family transcriptional regulator [Sphingobacteriales bacterium]|nr:MAG: Crp/Fnr family transcriptional regulator [Sphingobacteriales bacterium]